MSATTAPAPGTDPGPDLTDKPTWTIEDCCQFLDISHDTLSRWRERGEFPEPRVLPGGRLIRWDSAEVLDWFDNLLRAAA